MLALYIVAAAAAIPVIDRMAFPLFSNPRGWWIVPLLFLGITVGLILLHLAVVAVSVLCVRLDRPAGRASGYFRFLANITLPMLFRIAGVRIHTTGTDKLPSDTRILLVCNHIHDFDPAVIISQLPECELAFIGKKEIYTDMPFVARFMHKLHCLPIDRENNREAVKTIVSAAKLIKDDVVSIGIFPEGYTSKDGNLQPMRNGAFKIAYKANVPIVICTIKNTKQIIKNLFRKKTDVYFDICEVIYPQQFEKIHTTELGNHVYNVMKQSLDKIN